MFIKQTASIEYKMAATDEEEEDLRRRRNPSHAATSPPGRRRRRRRRIVSPTWRRNLSNDAIDAGKMVVSFPHTDTHRHTPTHWGDSPLFGILGDS